MNARLLIVAVVSLFAALGCASGTEPAGPSSAPATLQATAAAPTSTLASSPTRTLAPSPTGPVSMCEDIQGTDTGSRSVGTVSGSIASGRILIGIEAAAGPSGTFALAYIDPTGLHEIATTSDFTLAHAVWETDKTLVFDSERNHDRHLFRMTIADGAVTQITDGDLLGQGSAAILPDGRIVHDQFSCQTPVDLGLGISVADGRSTTQLTPARQPNDRGFDSQAAVSPDGRKIAFIRFLDEHRGGLFVIDAAGGMATRLTPDQLDVGYPRWSPDGKTILFTQLGNHGSDEVWTVPAAGGDATQVTDNVFGNMSWEADWSPDGRQIVFKHYEQGWSYNALHTAMADGSNDQLLWTGDYSTAETPDWSP